MEKIRSSLVMREIEKIVSGGPTDVNFSYTAELLANDKPVRVHRVNFINIKGDYGEDYQNEIRIGFKVEPTVYQKLVYPNRNNLMVHLIRTPVNEQGGGASAKGPAVIQKLRAYLLQDHSLLTGQQMEIDEEGLDLLGMMDLPLQIVNPLANRVRLHMVGQNYREMTPAQVLCAALQRAIVENRGVPKIQLHEPDNNSPRPAIVIPHGKTVFDLPHYLQDYQGGIYNAGIRMFFQSGIFYIFPKYYLGDRPGDKKVLTIFNLPPNQFPGAERTYRITDYQVMVISTGQSQRTDMTSSIELNEGNGIRFTNADAVLEGMVVGSGNKSVMRRGFANSEFLSSETGRDVNFAPVSLRRITANPFAEVSRLAASKGFIEQFVWENADPNQLYPGMPVRIISQEKNNLIEREGSLVGAEYHLGPKTADLRNSHMTCTGGLAVYANKKHRVIG